MALGPTALQALGDAVRNLVVEGTERFTAAAATAAATVPAGTTVIELHNLNATETVYYEINGAAVVASSSPLLPGDREVITFNNITSLQLIRGGAADAEVQLRYSSLNEG